MATMTSSLIYPVFLLLFTFLPSPLWASVCSGDTTDLSMVWAIDVSSSLNQEEMEVQIQGYIDALNHPQVKQNLFYCQCTEVAVVLWADRAIEVFSFTRIDNDQAIEDLVSLLLEVQRSRVVDYHESIGYQTFISEAIRFSHELITVREPTTQRMLISVSGDGMESQLGVDTLEQMRERNQRMYYQGIQVNGVPIVVNQNSDFPRRSLMTPGPTVQEPQSGSSPYEGVVDFYQREVITPHGYVEVAENYQDFSRAIQRSMIRDTCNLIM
jgi:hypothetical protein